MKLKRALINLCVLAGSTAFALFAVEYVARLFLNPADYLSVEMVEDKALGARPAPAAAAVFDSWGFRNRRVPENADIVAIGDSHTYGNTARMEDSWPYVLARLAGRSVYNMGMGGYGPNQYFELLKTKALSLRPRIVLCGLYMGDDFENAYLITYGLEHWAYLRQHQVKDVRFDIWNTAPASPSGQKKARIWLSRHSLIYQLLLHGPMMGPIQGEIQIRDAAKFYPAAVTLNVPQKGILEAFLPEGMLQRIDQDSPAVLEGMRITFELLREMNNLCKDGQIAFVVVVIPTKELVFSDYLEHNPSLPLSTVLDKLVTNSRLAREKTFRFLNDSGIAYVDTLPALQKGLGNHLYARTAADMHPGKNGYRVIAEAVSKDLGERRLLQ